MRPSSEPDVVEWRTTGKISLAWIAMTRIMSSVRDDMTAGTSTVAVAIGRILHLHTIFLVSVPQNGPTFRVLYSPCSSTSSMTCVSAFLPYIKVGKPKPQQLSCECVRVTHIKTIPELARHATKQDRFLVDLKALPDDLGFHAKAVNSSISLSFVPETFRHDRVTRNG